MSESVAHSFLTALMPVRDELYRAALARLDPSAVEKNRPEKLAAHAEDLLGKAVRKVFQQCAQRAGAAPEAALPEPPAKLGDQIIAQLDVLGAKPGDADILVAPSEGEAMPAAIWARLAAAIQIDAAKLPGGKLLNPDSVLLAHDPLLAPKKPRFHEDPHDGEVLSPPSRFAAIAVIAVVLGVALTVYLARRPAPKPEAPATSASVPANNS